MRKIYKIKLSFTQVSKNFGLYKIQGKKPKQFEPLTSEHFMRKIFHNFLIKVVSEINKG